MKHTLAILPILALAACAADGSLTPQGQKALAIACNVDGVVVPIAQPVVAGAGSAGATAAGVDALLVHPLVVQYCQAQGGKPVAVPATVAAAKP